MTGMNCLRLRSDNEGKFVASSRNPACFMIVTGRECSSLWAFPESHEFF